MNKEIELKYDVPLQYDCAKLLQGLEEIITQNGFSVLLQKHVTRTFQYYDTLDLQIYQKGETIRRVGGFDLEKDKGLFRYDFKIGPINDRYEKNHWANEVLDAQSILKTFGLERFYGEILESAYADTEHQQIVFGKGMVKLEATVDYFKLQNGKEFKEFEVELKDGDVGILHHVGRRVEDIFHLECMSKQKYTRVIELMNK